MACNYNFPITGNFKLFAGGVGDLNGGFVYNLRNGNNNFKHAYINLAASGMVIWNLRIKNRPITPRYQVNLPFCWASCSAQLWTVLYEYLRWDIGMGLVKFTLPCTTSLL